MILGLNIAMNEALIYFWKDKEFLNFEVGTIGNWIRIALGIMLTISILIYIKDKGIEVEVKEVES